MIETFYNNFGFAGALGIAFGSFILFIFWVAGVAGIADRADESYKNQKLIISVFIPIYPILWMWIDMYQDYSNMHHLQSKDKVR